MSKRDDATQRTESQRGMETAARIAETTHDADAGDLMTDVRAGLRVAKAIREAEQPHPTPEQSEAMRVEALLLALGDLERDIRVGELTEDEARQVLARVDVRDPLRPIIDKPR